MTPCDHARPFAGTPCFEIGRVEGETVVDRCPNAMVGEYLVVPVRVAVARSRFGRVKFLRYTPVRLGDRWTFKEVRR